MKEDLWQDALLPYENSPIKDQGSCDDNVQGKEAAKFISDEEPLLSKDVQQSAVIEEPKKEEENVEHIAKTGTRQRISRGI